ncbi:hypothetical protein BGX28_002565 [Mortierella sp. GBA30]|nr:hypothetical protein BGX28_002565 [Mortierella sp. GBA30]
MDVPRQESLVYSPSLRKSLRTRSPRKSTPSRLYLRLPFPTIGQFSSTTSHISPGQSFKERQQLLRDAFEEQEREKQLEQQESQHDEGLQRAITPGGQSDVTTSAILKEQTLLSSTSSASIPASAIHARQAQEISGSLSRILETSPSSKRTRSQPVENIPTSFSTTRQLRTTETEYDVSSARTTHLLSSPSRSLYEGTPSRGRRGLQEPLYARLDSEPSPFISPSIVIATCKRQEQGERGTGTLMDAIYSRGKENRSLSKNMISAEGAEAEENIYEVLDRNHDRSQERVLNKNAYDHVDGEVSFKRVDLSLSSNQSTMVEQNQFQRRSQRFQGQSPEPEEQEQIIDHRGGLGTHLTSGHETEEDAESSLLEVVETTAAIAGQLRGVYSNLQEFFSPTTEAKLNEAISVIGSHKKEARVQSHILSASISKPLVFETSPISVSRLPLITKRKHAPLRPAIIPKQTRVQPAPQPGSVKLRQYDVPITGLISNAESARRLNHVTTTRQDVTTDENTRESKAKMSTRTVLTVPEPFTLETEARGERHQERFQKKLERWKRIEREQQFKALPLPVYSDLFIPTKSSRPLTRPEPVVLQTDRRTKERHVVEREKTKDRNRNYKEKVLQDVRAQKAREDEFRKLQREMRQRRQKSGMTAEVYVQRRSRTGTRLSSRPLTVPKSPNIGAKRPRGLSDSEEKTRAVTKAADDAVNYLNIREGHDVSTSDE